MNTHLCDNGYTPCLDSNVGLGLVLPMSYRISTTLLKRMRKKNENLLYQHSVQSMG